MAEKYSPTIENYLGLLYVLDRDSEPAVGTRIAEQLGVSPPTVTNTLKRMVRDGLVEMDASHLPHLTPTGREAARSLMRRHMLAKWILSRHALLVKNTRRSPPVRTRHLARTGGSPDPRTKITSALPARKSTTGV